MSGVAAERVAELLDEVGIASELLEPQPRRTSVVALGAGRVDRSLSPLLVHGHLDVVPANADDWSVPPFSVRWSTAASGAEALWT